MLASERLEDEPWIRLSSNFVFFDWCQRGNQCLRYLIPEGSTSYIEDSGMISGIDIVNIRIPGFVEEGSFSLTWMDGESTTVTLFDSDYIVATFAMNFYKISTRFTPIRLNHMIERLRFINKKPVAELTDIKLVLAVPDLDEEFHLIDFAEATVQTDPTLDLFSRHTWIHPTAHEALGYSDAFAVGSYQDSMKIARECLNDSDVDQRQDNWGRTGLMIAGRFGDSELMKKFIERGADIMREARMEDVLTNALFGRNEACIDLLLNQPEAAFLVERNKYKPLLGPVVSIPRILERLIAMGADVNAGDETGYTALHDAVIRDCFETVQRLIEKGANVDAVSMSGSTPLMLVRSINIAEILIANGASVNHKSNGKRTPLHSAIWDRRWDIVNMLLDKGADPTVVGDLLDANAFQYSTFD
jgi:hypothetical protein